MGLLKSLATKLPSRSKSKSPVPSKSQSTNAGNTSSSSPSSASSATDAPIPPAPDAPRVIVIGAGSRGTAYATPLFSAGAARIVAVAEPRDHVRNEFGKTFIWGADGVASETQSFAGWEEWIGHEVSRRADAVAAGVSEEEDAKTRVNTVFVCVMDHLHLPVVKALGPLGLHIMCEKPLATTLGDCLEMYAAVRAGWASTGKKRIFGIGHVLRYAPHNVLLRKLVREEKIVGEVMSVEHTEPVGWWHYTHSYVRGNWRKESTSAPSLLTKSCHDMDFLLWLLSSPTTGSASTVEPPHLPSTITSTGNLRLFRKARKPLAAGNATNCLSCPHEKDCNFSAKNVYITKHLEMKDTGWPLKIVVPEIEDLMKTNGMEGAKNRLLEVLSEDYDSTTPAGEVASRTWYGRCVFESDNDTCDDQTVTMEWADDPLPGAESTEVGGLVNRGAKTAIFHMVAFTEAICARRGHIYGTDGEIRYNSEDIWVHNFRTGYTKTHHIPAPVDQGHGGGDDGLAWNMANAVVAVEKGDMSVDEAQWKYLGVDLEEVVRSHAAVFAAEEARLQGKVVDWKEWWTREVEAKMEELDLQHAKKSLP